MSWFEATRIDNQASRDDFDFWERVSHSNDAKPPLNVAYAESWVVGGEKGGGSIMVEKLPIEAFQIRGLPIYYDPSQDIWFVDGYPENFATAAEATAYAESLVPEETLPETPVTNWVAPIIGVGALLVMLR